MLKEELQQLHEQGSYVGEVSKVMDKKKVLVKVCFNIYNCRQVYLYFLYVVFTGMTLSGSS